MGQEQSQNKLYQRNLSLKHINQVHSPDPSCRGQSATIHKQQQLQNFLIPNKIDPKKHIQTQEKSFLSKGKEIKQQITRSPLNDNTLIPSQQSSYFIEQKLSVKKQPTINFKNRNLEKTDISPIIPKSHIHTERPSVANFHKNSFFTNEIAKDNTTKIEQDLQFSEVKSIFVEQQQKENSQDQSTSLYEYYIKYQEKQKTTREILPSQQEIKSNQQENANFENSQNKSNLQSVTQRSFDRHCDRLVQTNQIQMQHLQSPQNFHFNQTAYPFQFGYPPQQQQPDLANLTVLIQQQIQLAQLQNENQELKQKLSNTEYLQMIKLQQQQMFQQQQMLQQLQTQQSSQQTNESNCSTKSRTPIIINNNIISPEQQYSTKNDKSQIEDDKSENKQKQKKKWKQSEEKSQPKIKVQESSNKHEIKQEARQEQQQRSVQNNISLNVDESHYLTTKNNSQQVSRKPSQHFIKLGSGTKIENNSQIHQNQSPQSEIINIPTDLQQTTQTQQTTKKDDHAFRLINQKPIKFDLDLGSEQKAKKTKQSLAECYEERKRQLCVDRSISLNVNKNKQPAIEEQEDQSWVVNINKRSKEEQIKLRKEMMQYGKRVRKNITARAQSTVEDDLIQFISDQKEGKQRAISPPNSQLLQRLANGEKVKIESKDMYALTRKNYENLPEVKQKKTDEIKKKQKNEFIKERQSKIKELDEKIKSQLLQPKRK